MLARQLIGLRFAATLCLRVSSALLWPCPKHANPPHGGPRAILQLQSLRWSTIAAATMSRSESARAAYYDQLSRLALVSSATFLICAIAALAPCSSSYWRITKLGLRQFPVARGLA